MQVVCRAKQVVLSRSMDLDYSTEDEWIMWDSIVERVQEAEVFTRKFGSFSKSDYEVLMFTVYLDSLKEPVRDYDISITLGITESKVRSLRVRSQLLYPRDFDWKEELAKSIENGYYNKETKDFLRL